MTRNQSYFPVLLTVPVVIGLLALLLYPTLYIFYVAFQDPKGASAFAFTLANFTGVLGSSDFWHNVKITLIFTIASTAVSFILGLSMAYALEFVDRSRGLFLSIFIIPLATMPVASSLIWRTMMDPTLGVLNHLLGYIGLGGFDWATSGNTALFSVILVDVWQWTPFCFLILHAGFRTLPAEVHEAAMIDGAGMLRELWDISLPLLANIMIITLIFRFMEAFKAFDTIYVITQGGPGDATETLVLRAYQEAFQFYKPAVTSVIGIWLLIFTILCTRFAADRVGRGDVA